jgi:glutamate-1-semialdehyde aminotransferase
MMGLEDEPVSYVDALKHRKDAMLEFIRQTASRGVYFHDYGGGPCHHGFSAAYTREDLSRVLEVVETSFKKIKDIFSREV